MTIGAWVGFILLAVLIGIGGFAIAMELDSKAGLVATIGICFALIIGLYLGGNWYFDNTASGQRALTDQKSELGNGLNRVVTVYTADGKELAKFEGKIDIEGNDGGYVLFDFEGKRYTYYNCFVESVADIG